MKHKFLPKLSTIIELVLILGTLAPGLQKIKAFREAISVSQVNAQTASQRGSVTTSTILLPVGEDHPLSQQGITSTTVNFLSTVFSSTVFSSKAITPTSFGGGDYRLPHVPHLTDQQRQEIQKEIDKNVDRLGLQKQKNVTPLDVSLSWPLRAAKGLTDYSYYGVSNFVDHNSGFPNQLLDYSCGARTYDLSSGYNHRGTDIFTWPFGWNKMDNDEVEVVAASPGTIVFKQDGNFDRSCGFNNNPWNAVYVQHSDSSIAWYGHLKRSSVTSKSVGATVARGEYLGVVGSSGSSTGPHLHLELYSGRRLIDPYAGSCNNISSWWASQKPYYDSGVNKITTGSSTVVFPTCPAPEIPDIKNQFYPGDYIYFTTYYRDQLSSQLSQYTIYGPDGSIYQRWTHNSPASHYAASYWWWSFILGPDASPGTWKFKVVFNEQSYEHSFRVGQLVYLPTVLKGS